MRKNLPFLIVGAAAAWWIWSKYRLSTATRLVFQKINLAGKGLQRKLELIFQLMNPTSSTGTINSIDGQVYVNGKHVGDFYNYMPQAVAARSQNEVRVTVHLAGGLVDLLLHGDLIKKGVQYDISGQIVLDGVPAPFTYSGKI